MTKKYLCNGRPVTITESYEGHGVDDPSGYYYRFDDDPGQSHWISTAASAIRFKPMDAPSDKATHWVRIHRPFSHPKQWVVGPLEALSFTDNQSRCGKYTKEQAETIIDQLHARADAGAGFVIEMDGI